MQFSISDHGCFVLHFSEDFGYITLDIKLAGVYGVYQAKYRKHHQESRQNGSRYFDNRGTASC